MGVDTTTVLLRVKAPHCPWVEAVACRLSCFVLPALWERQQILACLGSQICYVAKRMTGFFLMEKNIHLLQPEHLKILWENACLDELRNQIIYSR